MILKMRPEILAPHILVASRNGLPEAILVGRLERVELSPNIGYTHLLKIRARKLSFLHGGALGRITEENSLALTKAIIGNLGTGEADLAAVNYLEVDSPLYTAAKETPTFCLRDHAPQTQFHRSMKIPVGPEDFYKRLSGKVRKNLKWQAKKLQNDFAGQVTIKSYPKAGCLDQMFRDIEQIASSSYQRALGAGFVDSAEMRSRMQLALERDWLRAYVLYICDKACAFWVGTAYRGVLYSNFMGYKREYARYSPGMYLVVSVIEGLCRESGPRRIERVDFGLGDAQYKEVLSDQEWKEGTLSIFAPSLKGLSANLLLTPPVLIDKWAKSALEKTGLLQAIKTTWRRRLSKS